MPTTRRWKVQGFLLDAVTGCGDKPYAAIYRRWHWQALRTRQRIYNDHGPGMVRVEVTKVD